MTDLDAVDKFAGPGGWDVAARRLGLEVEGIELDDAAVLTRAAAGHRTRHASVLDVPIADYDGVRGLIASPPCQTFSLAGNGAGRRALRKVLLGLSEIAGGRDHPEFDDVRTALVLQPLIWALQLRPEWIAWEQVAPVLPVWEAAAEVLAVRGGYYVATGLLHAEQFGVPQTRTRAVLVARRDRPVRLPRPTHRLYVKGVDRSAGDQRLQPWVSMADALGWGAAPAGSVPVEMGDTQAHAAIRGIDEPAPTVTCSGNYLWRFAGAGLGSSAGQIPRELDEPAHTLTGKGTAAWLPPAAVPGDTSWVHDRPSPTIVGSFHPEIVAAPSYRGPGSPPRQDTPGSVRVTVEQAGVLQSFPADYPWRGNQGKQYQQAGNAVPPLLAEAILRSVTAP